jgi:hypothetical protein
MSSEAHITPRRILSRPRGALRERSIHEFLTALKELRAIGPPPYAARAKMV